LTALIGPNGRRQNDAGCVAPSPALFAVDRSKSCSPARPIGELSARPIGPPARQAGLSAAGDMFFHWPMFRRGSSWRWDVIPPHADAFLPPLTEADRAASRTRAPPPTGDGQILPDQCRDGNFPVRYRARVAPSAPRAWRAKPRSCWPTSRRQSLEPAFINLVVMGSFWQRPPHRGGAVLANPSMTSNAGGALWPAGSSSWERGTRSFADGAPRGRADDQN